MSYNISKKRKLVKDGLFYAEVNEFLRRYLSVDGYAGVELKQKPDCVQVVIKCTKTPEIVKKIPEIQKLLQLRFKYPPEGIKIFAEKVQPRGLSARAQAQSICYKLTQGVAVRRACYSVLKYIMDNGSAKGVQIIISGKLRGARAKAMKFKEGFMISSGNATREYIVEAVEHVLLRSGTIGVRVTIMLPQDLEGNRASFLPKNPLPDVVTVKDPKTLDYEDDYDQQAAQPPAEFQPQAEYAAPMEQNYPTEQQPYQPPQQTAGDVRVAYEAPAAPQEQPQAAYDAQPAYQPTPGYQA